MNLNMIHRAVVAGVVVASFAGSTGSASAGPLQRAFHRARRLAPRTWAHLNVDPWIRRSSETDTDCLLEVRVLHVDLDALRRARDAEAVGVGAADPILVRVDALQALRLVERAVGDA